MYHFGMVRDFDDHSFSNYFCSVYKDLSKRTIKFTKHGDGIGTYDIFQYQIVGPNDALDYRTIGEFSDTDQNQER